MATEKPRILITVDEELLKDIDDFRYENRIPTRSEAVRRLVKEGLKTSKKPKK